MSPGKIKCRQCRAELYTFEQLAILGNENKLVVVPEIALKRSKTTERRENHETGKGDFGWKLHCRNCEGKIGVCLADTITANAYDEIRPKYVVFEFPNGLERYEDKWKEVLPALVECGVSRISQKDFLRRAGRKFYSRDGRPIHPTFLVDVDRTSDDTLKHLTATKMRNYQMEMLTFCLKQNSLLCLPTGSGKTLVAAGVLRAMLHINPHKVAAFVVNTNHLVGQQSHVLKTELSAAKVVTVFGQMHPDQRRKNLKIIGEFQYDILVSTCACMNAMMEISTVRVEDLCCLVLDEAHETKGDSPYAELLGRVLDKNVQLSSRPLIMGMTASPLDNAESTATAQSVEKDIREMGMRLHCHPCFPCKNDPYDNGMRHTHDWAFIVDPGQKEFEFKQQLDDYMREVTRATQHRLIDIAPLFGSLEGLLTGDDREVDTNKLRGKLRKIEGQLDEARDKERFRSRTEDIYYGYAMRDHMNQILAVHEVNNVIGHDVAMQQLKKVFYSIEDPAPGQEQRKKEALYGYKKSFDGQPLYASLFQKVQRESKSDVYKHHLLSNKCKRMIEMIQEHYEEHRKDTRILVFVDMRRTARKLCSCFAQLNLIQTALNPQVIVGRGICGDGLSLEEQQEILNDFRRGQTKLLVTTTILEEGLDVPSCNMVLRMKAPENLRQFIQSRGRACRAADGKFYIICKSEAEKNRQQLYLSCMQTQADVIQLMMKNRYHFDQMTSHSKVPLDLEEDTGRRIIQKEEAGPQANGISEAELQEMLDIMKQVDVDASQEELPFLDEDESEKVEVAVRFAIFVQDDKMYQRARDHIKKAIEITHPEVQIHEWIDKELKIENAVGTHYFPEALLTLNENSDRENAHRFEKSILGLFTSPIFHSELFNIWTSLLNRRSYFPRSTALRLSLHQTFVGSLKWQRTFVQQMRLGQASSLRLERGFDRIVITVNDELQIEASFADLRDFAVVDFQENANTEDSVLTLYLTFSQTPRLSRMSQSDNEGRETSQRVYGYGEPNSCHVFANCFTYKLEIPNPRAPTQHNLIDHRVREVLKLLESSGVTVYFTSMQTTFGTAPFLGHEEGLDLTKCSAHSQNPEVHYAMRCLTSSAGFVMERMDDRFYQILNSMQENEAIRTIYELARVMSKKLFCDPVQFMERAWKSAIPDTEIRPPSSNHAYMKRIIITPTSLRFYEPDLIQTNRIVREYNAEIFIRVGIRDENCDNLTSLYGDLPHITNRIRDILMNGIKIGPHQYVYLAASNSQIRAHSSYFIRDDGCCIAEKIRDGIGDLTRITQVPRYMSRLGLAFSTSVHTVSVAHYYTESDVEAGDYCFSDGVGLISASLALKVKEKQCLEHSSIPSAFQIRIGGCKGMVSVWDDDFFRRKGYTSDLVVRHSMLKYPSDSKGIEVLEFSRPLPLHLNQQVIMLLSNVGVGDDVFMDLLKNKIVQMGKMFVEEDAAVKALQATVSREINRLQRVRFQFTSDPFFRNIMKASYRFQMQDMRERSRVRLDEDKGRVLIGVMDEEGVLESGQVFIQISEDLDKPGVARRVITSTIVIMKNPCIHPGDVRTLEGKDIPQLRHLVDCVVFPQKGPRPHPNELSGSDLDGDQYHCIWDMRLLPTIPIKEPMDYTGAKQEERPDQIGLRHIADYICAFIENDTLGMIDNTHKALADQRGLESEICLDLSELHAKAVDAPKTGSWTHLPSHIKSELTKYPDFMMKVDKPSYPSMNVLGQMFRECNKYMMATTDPATAEQSSRPHPDEAFKVEGYKDYITEAHRIFKQYNQEILTIMRMYGIETEAEMWSGVISTYHPRLESELDDVRKNVKFMLEKIKTKYKAIFFTDSRLDEADGRVEEKKKASAWYYAAYASCYGDQYSVGNEMQHFLSFPWILKDLLAEIYSDAASKQRPQRSIYSEISDSVKEIFNGTIDKLYKAYEHHIMLARFLGETCQRVALCVLFGASHLLLFDDQRGEVCILVMKKRRQVYDSENIALSKEDQLTRLDRVKSECSSLFAAQNLNTEQCHLRVRVFKRLPKTKARLSANPAEVVKWIVIKKYFFKHQWLFPALRILFTWMMATGLVGGRVFFLPDYLVPLMFIDHCLKAGELHPIPPRQFLEAAKRFFEDPLHNDCFGTDNEWKSLHQNLTANRNDEISDQPWEGESGRVGRLLCTFMKQGTAQIPADLHPELSQALKVERWNDEARTDMLTLLSAEMEKASHRLSLHVNASVLLSKVPIERLFFIKLEASRLVVGDEDGLTRMLHQRSGAWVDVQSRMSALNPGKIVKGVGTEAELYLLEKQIEMLNAQADEQQKTGRTLRVRGTKDVTGAHNLLVETAVGTHASIRLEPYLGYKYPQHDYKRLYVVRLRDRPATSAVDPTNTDNFDQFRQHFRRQLAHFQRQYSPEVNGPCEIQVKFGRSYVVSPPQSFVEDATHLTTEDLLKALERRKSRFLDPMFDSGHFRRVPRGERANDGFISTSFVASVFFDDEERDFLKQRLINSLTDIPEDQYKGDKEEGVKVVAQTGTGVVTARYDADLKFVGIETAPIRWIVSDVKRQCVCHHDEVEGRESDIRFMLKTQVSEVTKLEDHALAKDFIDAIGIRENNELYIKSENLDVDYMEHYTIFKYPKHKMRFGVPYQLVIRQAKQYTRRLAQGRYSNIRDVSEVRIVPSTEPFLDNATVENAVEALWREAFDFSDKLKCKTQ